MKIALLTDIHANLFALKAVLADLETWQPDQVIIAGDILNRGSRPAECLKLALDKQASDGWQVLRGNHEEYVIAQAKPAAAFTPQMMEVHRPSRWALQQIGGDASMLKALPERGEVTDPAGGLVMAVHGSLLGMRDGIYPESTDDEIFRKMGYSHNHPYQKFSAFCVGHTHRTVVRRLNGTLVVNAGSVGLPFDGDTRAAYARLTWSEGRWEAEIVRVAYDIEKAIQDLHDSGYYEGGGPLIRIIEIELRYACSMLYSWAHNYQEKALRGEITIEESAERTLKRYGY